MLHLAHESRHAHCSLATFYFARPDPNHGHIIRGRRLPNFALFQKHVAVNHVLDGSEAEQKSAPKRAGGMKGSRRNVYPLPCRARHVWHDEAPNPQQQHSELVTLIRRLLVPRRRGVPSRGARARRNRLRSCAQSALEDDISANRHSHDNIFPQSVFPFRFHVEKLPLYSGHDVKKERAKYVATSIGCVQALLRNIQRAPTKRIVDPLCDDRRHKLNSVLNNVVHRIGKALFITIVTDSRSLMGARGLEHHDRLGNCLRSLLSIDVLRDSKIWCKRPRAFSRMSSGLYGSQRTSTLIRRQRNRASL